MASDIRIQNPASFVLPDGRIPVLELIVRRNQAGQVQDLVVLFEPTRTVREKLELHKSVPLELRGTAEQIDFPVEFHGWFQGDVTLGFQHLHQTKPDRNQIQKIERFLEMIASRQKKSTP